jgi:diguanylate cyclase (GGDEF)-like protein
MQGRAFEFALQRGGGEIPSAMRKILMIDDDRLQFRITQRHFKNFHADIYELEWAATFEDGLARLLTGGYVACLLDYQLGPKDGLQLIREAVAGGCRTPIVFLTVDPSSEVDIEALNAGALDYLVKGEISQRSLERSLRYALKLGDTLEALRRLATQDQLTGILNRREFDRIMEEEAERSQRFGQPLALVMVDIDHFKAVNDTHGHPAGDAVLKEVAKILTAQSRSVDRVARFGGEEFALILVKTDRAAAEEVAQRVVEAVAANPVVIEGGASLMVTISAGVAVLPDDVSRIDVLLGAADRALYAAKRGGRNRVVMYAELAKAT